MKRIVVSATVAVAWLAASDLLAQRGPDRVSKDLKIQSEVVAVAGCLRQEGSNWALTSGTPVLAKAEAVVDLTPTKAKDLPVGKERYRLIGLADIFNLPNRIGEKVLVKGLFIEDPKEKRINMTSVITLDKACK
jgi:hypothetical protein